MWTADADDLSSAQAYVEMLDTPFSTGWPELDRETGGLRRPSVIRVAGSRAARRLLLTRMSAWAAGDDYSVVHVDDHRSSLALATLVCASGHPERPTPDRWDLARLRLTTLGADDLGSIRQVIQQRRPLDLLILDGAAVGDPDRLAHALGTVIIVGQWDHVASKPESEARTWSVHQTEDNHLEVRLARDEGGDDEQAVHLQAPPRSRTPDLVRRAGHANLFSLGATPLPAPQ